MTERSKLLLATAATLPGSAAGEIRKLAGRGWDTLEEHFEQLPDERRSQAERIAGPLEQEGIQVALVGDPEYPQRLQDLPKVPPMIFWWGNLHLVNDRGVGMCGSRNASPRGLQYARLFGRAVVERGLQVISGYARGVDVETHLGALEAGGSTIVVLAEGISHFRRKRAFAHTTFTPENVLAVSQFPPSQPWSAGAAMTRNGTIVALSRALLVVEAGERGGTLNAGLQALAIGRPVFAVDYADDLPVGNRILFERGVKPLRSKTDLFAELDHLASTGTGHKQLVLGDH